MTYARGEVVKGPDVFGPNQHRPYVCLSQPSNHPFPGQEGLYIAVTTTSRPEAVPVPTSAFVSGGLPKRSFASPWVITTLKDADIVTVEGELSNTTVTQIAEAAAQYLGVRPASNSL